MTGNAAGAAPGQPGTTSDADGGGIYSRQGSLTLDRAIVSGNRATATSPAGRFAEGGGIWAGVPDFLPGGDSGRDVLVIQDSVISGNTASLSTDLPTVFGGQVQNLVANAGGVLVAGRTPTTTVENTVISNNAAIATDPNGEGGALDAALDVSGGSLDMSGSVSRATGRSPRPAPRRAWVRGRRARGRRRRDDQRHPHHGHPLFGRQPAQRRGSGQRPGRVR